MACLGVPSLAGLHHAALSVSDLDASIAWYKDVLGLEETFRQDSDTRRVVVMRVPGLRQTVGLVEHRGAGAAFDPQNLGLDHLAFSVASSEELEVWLRRLDDRRVSHSGIVETPFGGMLHFRDLDGIALAFFWERGWQP